MFLATGNEQAKHFYMQFVAYLCATRRWYKQVNPSSSRQNRPNRLCAISLGGIVYYTEYESEPKTSHPAGGTSLIPQHGRRDQAGNPSVAYDLPLTTKLCSIFLRAGKPGPYTHIVCSLEYQERPVKLGERQGRILKQGRIPKTCAWVDFSVTICILLKVDTNIYPEACYQIVTCHR